MYICKVNKANQKNKHHEKSSNKFAKSKFSFILGNRISSGIHSRLLNYPSIMKKQARVFKKVNPVLFWATAFATPLFIAFFFLATILNLFLFWLYDTIVGLVTNRNTHKRG